ncbi:DUF4248 domain-containing protein [Mediterranea massiliensis]|uniref:DUF4248 domain-containing protein n=1 Tax=Mediterranea massiliensis TaxID=1841865 RepID=UPI001F3746B0|nr:DUF4248 domain-containing protein [Mediterranea massiliensis]
MLHPLHYSLLILNSQFSIMKTITYTRRSLACQYFPDAEPEQAVRRLPSWIRRCRPLYAELTRGGTPFDKRRNLTVREARLILEYLGEP